MDNKLCECEAEREYHAANDIVVDPHEQAGLLDCGADEWGDTYWLGTAKQWDAYEDLTK